MNLGLGRGNGGNTEIGASDAQVEFPTLTIMAGEIGSSGDSRSAQRGDQDQGLADSTSASWTRHLDGANFAFANGHVK